MNPSDKLLMVVSELGCTVLDNKNLRVYACHPSGAQFVLSYNPSKERIEAHGMPIPEYQHAYLPPLPKANIRASNDRQVVEIAQDLKKHFVPSLLRIYSDVQAQLRQLSLVKAQVEANLQAFTSILSSEKKIDFFLVRHHQMEQVIASLVPGFVMGIKRLSK